MRYLCEWFKTIVSIASIIGLIVVVPDEAAASNISASPSLSLTNFNSGSACTALSSAVSANYGFENGHSCIIANAPNGYPYCTVGHYSMSQTVLGWGWEPNPFTLGQGSCVIPGGSSSVSSKTVPGSVIRASGTSIYSASGRKTIMRGVNLQYADDPSGRLGAIRFIRAAGANTIRLELRSSTTSDQLRAALDQVVQYNMVAVLMYWDPNAFSSDSLVPFAEAMDLWLVNWKPVLSDPKYSRYIIVNIINEWGIGGAANYVQAYMQAIHQMRDAGYAFPLMIDAPNSGQNFLGLALVGPTIASADMYKNIIFSVHAYWSFQTPEILNGAAITMLATGYPFVWGEFGNSQFENPSYQAQYDPSQPGNYATDHAALMSQADQLGISYIGWSWHGNGWPVSLALDMSSQDWPSSFTSFGVDYFNKMWTPVLAPFVP